jgi:hypothetical protein
MKEYWPTNVVDLSWIYEMGQEEKQVWETVGIEFVSREGFNNNDAASVAINCLNGGGYPVW